MKDADYRQPHIEFCAVFCDDAIDERHPIVHKAEEHVIVTCRCDSDLLLNPTVAKVTQTGLDGYLLVAIPVTSVREWFSAEELEHIAEMEYIDRNIG